MDLWSGEQIPRAYKFDNEHVLHINGSENEIHSSFCAKTWISSLSSFSESQLVSSKQTLLLSADVGSH